MKKEKVIKTIISVVGVGAIMASMLALTACNENKKDDSKGTTAAQPTAASGATQAGTSAGENQTEYITAVVTGANGEKQTVVVGRRTVAKTDAAKTTVKNNKTTKKTAPQTTKKPAKTTAKKTNKPKPTTTKKNTGGKIYEEPDFSKMKFTTKKTSDGGIVIIPGGISFADPVTVYPTDLWTNWSTSDVQYKLFLSKGSISSYYIFDNASGQWGACSNIAN